MLQQTGFFGTNATLIADLTLVAEIVFFSALLLGVIAQRTRRYKWHDRIQTPVVVLNLFVILFIMVASFVRQDVLGALPQRPGDPYYQVVAIHAGLGLAAQGLALYCLLAGHKILPRKIGRLRYWMWATLGLWTAAVALGAGTYYTWYVRQPSAAGSGSASPASSPQPASSAPASRQVLLQNFEFMPPELTVLAGTSVTWVNQDGAPHNITLVNGDVASQNFFRGENFTTTFDTPGTYQVYCSLHGNTDGSGMAMTVTVVEASEENAAAIAAAEAAQPAPLPAVATPPTPTPAPSVPPPPVALAEPPAPDKVVAGLVSFFDSAAPSDALDVLLSGIPVPEPNTELHGWLTDSRGSAALDIGRMEIDANAGVAQRYVDEQHRNLLGLYDGFQITQEPQFDDDPTPGRVLYSGRSPGQALASIRALVVTAADTPGQQAYALGARRQAEEVSRHVAYVQDAFDRRSLADVQRHAEHVVNLLEGEAGQFFGDLDGDGLAQEPGDGFGVIPYVRRVGETAAQASQAGDATQAIQTHAGHVQLAADNALDWALFVRGEATEIVAAQRVEDIGPQVETLVRYSRLLLAGEDGNADGEIAPDEGGIFTAYQHAQYMAAIAVAAGDQ